MFVRALLTDLVCSLLVATPALPVAAQTNASEQPYVLVLGIAQDGGVPQAGTKEHPGWDDPAQRRLVSCLAIVDPATSQRWLLDATPDFREQLHHLDVAAPVPDRPGLAGIFLTHAHMGHYTGLMHLGYESMGADAVPVYAMPRMGVFLRDNGPWSQLVDYRNIEIRPLTDGATVRMNDRLELTAFLVPHRQEYSEVAGFIVHGPQRAVLFIPDIDSWEEWDEWGSSIESMIAKVDIAYLDATFFDNGELPGRDMSTIPHPMIVHSMERFASLPESERVKIRFIHLNHTNPALRPDSNASREIIRRGFRVAKEGDVEEL